MLESCQKCIVFSHVAQDILYKMVTLVQQMTGFMTGIIFMTETNFVDFIDFSIITLSGQRVRS